MSNAFLQFRSLIIYALCVPLAVFLGWLLSTPDDLFSFLSMLLVLALLLTPMLLKWHHFWLLAFWNMQAVLFFLPGRPSFAMAMAGLSLLISVLQHTLNREVNFIHVRTIALPLWVLTGLVLLTAKLTGGIGLAITGASSIGGKKYVSFLAGIIGYHALVAHRIPPRKAVMAVMIFYLFAVTTVIASMPNFLAPSWVYYILLIFPPEAMYTPDNSDFIGAAPVIERLGGVSVACIAIFSAMLAKYGVSGIFNGRHWWRAIIFVTVVALSLFGGFRSMLLGVLLTFTFVFFFEGAYRTKLLPIFLFLGLSGLALSFPLANKLPPSVQRTISFIPFVPIDPYVQASAQDSTDWRVEMWKQVWDTEVPNHLWLGKGYTFSAEALQTTSSIASTEGAEGAMLAGDYHSGPLSVLVPFGIPGCIVWLWFLGAGIRVLYCNYRYGDPLLKKLNTFLFASFLAKAIFFFVVFGSVEGDTMVFCGLLGLSISINGGMAKAPSRVVLMQPATRADREAPPATAAA